MKKAVIALSGGMDSITSFYWALDQGYELKAVSFFYGQNHSKELDMAKWNCEQMNVEHEIIDISFLGKITSNVSSLTSGSDNIPEGMYDADNMKSTVVPFRNGIILAVLAAYAEANECQAIICGVHAGDHAIYPDCRATFIDAMNKAIGFGTYENIEILTPFLDDDKTDICYTGLSLNVPYEKTWTCYKGQEAPCGKCGSCVERIEAFLGNDSIDPLYSNRQWKDAVDNYNTLKGVK